jgi:hypothetical protein
MRTPIVHILVSVPDPARLDACTLCFDTLRVGFPTAEIHVYINGVTHLSVVKDVYARARKATQFIYQLSEVVHLSDWIERRVAYAALTDAPLVICDADTVFWKSCEEWEFPSDTLLAGYFVPKMWNDFAKCVSMARIHTSMMVFPRPDILKDMLTALYPYSHSKAGEYCPCNPYMTTVQYVNGRPVFWDACANLFQMLTSYRASERAVYTFGPDKLASFDHLNSASFYDVMMERMDDNRGFALAHNEWVKDPAKLKNLWPIIDRYYQEKAIQACVYED